MTTPSHVRSYPASGTLGVSNNRTITTPMDATGSDFALFFVIVGIQGGNVTGVTFSAATYGAQALTQLGSIIPQANSPDAGMAIFYKASPLTGTNNLVLTFTGGTAGTLDQMTVCAQFHLNVASIDGTVTVDNVTGAVTSDTMSRTVVANNLTTGVWCHGSNIATISNGTLRGVINNFATNTASSCAANIEGGSNGTLTIGYTSGSSDSRMGFMVELVGTGGAPTLTVADMTVPVSSEAPVLKIPNPVVATHTFEVGTSLSTTNAQPLPASAAAGDLILYFIGVDNPAATAVSVSTGWTLLSSQVQGSNVINSNVAVRVLDGTTGNNICSVTGAAQDYSIAAIRIASGNHGVVQASIATDIKIAGTTGTTGNADPPSLNTGSSKAWLVLACAIVDLTTGNTITAAPSGHVMQENNVSASSTSSVATAVSAISFTGTTIDPGAFANTSRGWISYTVAIPPFIPGLTLVVSDLNVAVTAAAPALTQHNVLTVAAMTVPVSVPNVTFGVPALYPASVSNRKWLDQNGAVYLGKFMSSWGMAQNLSDSEIDTALTSLASLGFTGVLVAMSGISENGGWNPLTNKAGAAFWTGSPWQSSLGSGWSSFDHIVSKANELGITVLATLFLGSSDAEGANNELIAAWTANVNNPVTAGAAIATRYAGYNNIVWHMEADRYWLANDGSHIGEAVDAFFHGIKNVDGTRRQITYEHAQGVDGFTQFGSGFTYFLPTVQVLYNYAGNSVELIDDAWNVAGAVSAGLPVFDCEPPYYLANRYPSGNQTQQIRERTLSVFLRGGCGINFGHEAFWPFNYGGIYDAGEDWAVSLTDAPTLQASYAWGLVDTYCKDTTWARDGGTFLTTGVGSGDTKAASGFSNGAAIAYFPTSRTIVVDTTVISGTGNVRLRWWDPTAGTYSTISASEAQQSGRSVTYNGGTHADSGTDWVLVVDLVPVPKLTTAYWGAKMR